MDHLLNAFETQRTSLRQVSTASERRTMLGRLWESVLAHESELVRALAADLGKPREEVHLQEIYPVKAEIAHARKHLRGWMAPKPTPTPLAMLGTRSLVQPEPKGQLLIISPWNFPVILTLRPLVSALSAGNRVILKPSEHTPETSKVLASIVEQAVPADVATVVLGGPEVSAKLTSLPFQHICFTGGTNIGKKVMKAAAENLASVTLELGGKSPAVVDATAHLGDASRRLAWGKCLNNGQVCIAPDYALVEDAVADRFLTEVVARIGEMYGDSAEAQLMNPQRSRMVNRHHWQRLVGLIEDAVEKGARVVLGGHWNQDELRIAPTVLDGVTVDMKVMQEEIFGPVLPVLRWHDANEVNQIVSLNPHPLAMYFFSKNDAAVESWMGSNPAGTTGINEVILQVAQPDLPFGGIQTSGMGRTGGHEGFKQFSNMRSVVRQQTRHNILPLTFPPFGERSLWLARTVQRWL
ncbi:MAG: aldehyde dehydrogenase family protein [Flavobacteriales bacterium]